MAELLVSVRNAAEACDALRGGADIIDVKEPLRGALGRADDAVVRAVVEVARGTDRGVPQASSLHGREHPRAGRMPAVRAKPVALFLTSDEHPPGMGHPASNRPVSVALGELTEWANRDAPRLDGVRYAKVGLATCGQRDGWAAEWHALRTRIGDATDGRTELIAVAYADHVRAAAPAPAAVFELAMAARCGVLLIDTWRKDGQGLLAWMGVDALAKLADACRASGVRLALAGSLDAHAIAKMGAVGPDIVAVRGAACRDERRDGVVDAEAVQRLAMLTHAIEPSDSTSRAAAIGS